MYILNNIFDYFFCDFVSFFLYPSILGDRVQLLHMTPKEAFKLPIVNGRLYDIVHIRDEHSITSLLYDIVVSFDLIKHGGTLIVGDLRDHLSMSNVIENFGSIFSESIAKIHYIRDQIILIKK